jgi:hypothetical protein
MLVPALFLLPLSLDFKGNEAGGTWQYAIFGLSVLGWVLYFGKNRPLKPRGTLWRACQWAVLVTLGGSFVSLAVNGTPFINYAQVFASFALFGMAFFFGARMAHTGRTRIMNKLIDIGALISVAFTVIAGLVLTGQQVGEIRYQILSPVLLIFEAILLHKIMAAKTNVTRNTLLLVACLVLQIVSVTRSAILAFAVVLAASLWISSPSVGRFIRRSLRIAVPGLVAVMAAVVFGSAVSPAVVERWEQRVFTIEKYGVDPTTLSRLAEMKEQLDRWSSSPASILVGQGFGASYGWSQEFYDGLLDTGAFKLEGLEKHRSFFGHNYWVSSLFSGGILFGVALPIVLICAAWTGVVTARKALRRRLDEGIRLEISRAALMLVAGLAMTIGSNPLSTRYAPLLLGASLGVLVVLRRQALDRPSVAGWTAGATPVAS